ncbi:MAG: hypothetical protein IKX40_05345 [Thermoguttaceae bacterium]|nr:hypothetical protein [Thermoguttaceae bacterium]
MNDYSPRYRNNVPPSTKDEVSNLLGSRAKLAEEFNHKEHIEHKETIGGRKAFN